MRVERHPRLILGAGLAVALLLGCAPPAPAPSQGTVQQFLDEYVERDFALFPTRAVEAGRQDFGAMLEDLSAARLAGWIEFNRRALERLGEFEANEDLTRDERLDLELVERHARLALFDLVELERPRTDPLFWTEPIGNSTVFLLVRDDAPLEQRLSQAAARARQLPALALQAEEALAGGASQVAPEIAVIAADQVAASARFYGTGFAAAAIGQSDALQEELRLAGKEAQAGLDRLARFLETLAAEALGSPRLGAHYEELFHLTTGEQAGIDEVLARALDALAEKRRETAAYGRQAWGELMAGAVAPDDDDELIRRLFRRIGDDHAASVEEFVADYETLLGRAVEFVRQRDLITLPEPLTVHTARSPAFFVGQSVGGVYPAGPYSPADAKTLFFLPTPREGLTQEQRASFFRDFNHHFNVMITPHEMVPGHYLQLKLAARHPRRIRALFGDGVYIEGWGTFCERLMLDEGWGGTADRLAHLKKQLENIARTIVDIRVHTEDMGRDEVIAFVEGEAFQEAQFASNLWARSITSAPQLTSYFLGYSQVMGLYEEVRSKRGAAFELKAFMDGMMELGPVPVARYRELMLDGS
jgi:uncharacterized protein (DUF885 family)